jgi:hypothetical protein
MRLPALLLVAVTAIAAEIPQGAHVLLRMENSITTRTAQDGDYVYLRTATPISVAGNIILPSGSYVQGIVTKAQRSGRVKGRAELAIRLETVTLPSGSVYKFSPKLASIDSGAGDQKVGKENAVQEGSTHGQDAARIAILAGSGASIGAIVDQGARGAGIGAGAGAAVGLATVLLTRGREVELRQGTALDVTFDRPVTLE